MKNEIIIWDQEKCQTCYSCIRACPVKAIHVKGDSVFPYFEDSLCTYCGRCIFACAYKAITYHNSIKEVKALLNSEHKVAAICAPSIAGEFTDIGDYRKFVQMIRFLGFDYVHEMSFGVDVIASKFSHLIEPFRGRYYLTSHCPSVVELIEKHYPDQIDNLSPILPPHAATALIIRKVHGSKVKVVHITACIAAKASTTRYKGEAQINAVLTFKELRVLFDEYKIREALTEFSDFTPPYGNKGGLYPIPRGFLEASSLDNSILTGSTQTVDGQENVMEAIEQFQHHTSTLKKHFNLLSCEGCISANGMSNCSNKYLKEAYTKDYVQKRLTHFDTKSWQTEVEKHETHEELNTTFTARPYQLPEADLAQITAILGKITEPKNGIQLNCGACGYQTCYQLAKAVSQNIAIPEMCVPNSRIGSQEAVIVIRRKEEELHHTKSKISEYENSLQSIEQESNLLNAALSIFIKNLNAGVVLVNKDLKIIDSNMGFIQICGEEALEIHEVIPYLIGADIKTLLPANIGSQLTYLLQHNEIQINKDILIEDQLVNITLFQMVPNKMLGILIRNLRSEEE